MLYKDNLERIRRFLRDPDGNIWSDAFLLNLWNDEQKVFCRQHHFLRAVEILRHPPHYQMAYIHNFEYAYVSPTTGRSYKALIEHQQSPAVCSYLWEVQLRGTGTGSESDTGYRITHPWEGYLVATPADLVPSWFPADHRTTIAMLYDEEPIDQMSWKEMVSRDIAYKTYQGEPQWFVIKDDVSHEFYLYPRPGAVWDDVDGDSESGMVLHSDFTTESSETGDIIDASGGGPGSDLGLSIDLLRTADNVLLLYQRSLVDIAGKNESIDLPVFLQKYIEQAVIKRAYQANTDGQIKSLSDYWGWRKTISMELLSQFNVRRLADRDFRLTSGRGASRRRRGPRLPSTYPAV